MKIRLAWIFVLAIVAFGCGNNKQAEEIVEEATETEEKDEAITKSLKELMAHNWTLEKMTFEGENFRFQGAEKATITFKQGKAFGLGGCNNFFSDYTVEAVGQLSLSNIGATKKACPNVMVQEQRILQILEGVATYKILGRQLELAGKDGKLMYLFRD